MRNFLARANAAKAQAEEQKAERKSHSNYAGGIRIGALWLKEGDTASIRLSDVAEEYDDDGNLTRLPNPALLQTIKEWHNGAPKNSFVSPETFTGENPLKEARDDWFKNERARLKSSGKKPSVKDCPVPSVSTRYLMWGLVCNFQPGPHSQDVDPNTRLGMKGFEHAESVFQLFVETLSQMALRCEEDTKKLSIRQICCPHCAKTILTEEQINDAGIPLEELVVHAAQNFANLLSDEEETCVHCNKSLACPVVVVKHCAKCGEDREGMHPGNHNLLIKRLPANQYSITMDEDFQGPVSALPAELLQRAFTEGGEPIEGRIAYNPATGETESNFWDLKGISPAAIGKMIEKAGGGGPRASATSRRARSPLKLKK